MKRTLKITALFGALFTSTIAGAVGYNCDQIVEKTAYSACYNYDLKAALFVKTDVTVNELRAKNLSRKGIEFYPEPTIAPRYRAELRDYRRSGFDRGHLVSNGTLNFSSREQHESFSLVNVHAQHPKMNRGIWRLIEEASRRLMVKKGGAVMITGGVFSEINPQRIGAGQVAVPTHSFKIMKFGDGDILVFLVPNVNENMGKKPSKFKSSLAEIRRLTGFDFRNELR